MFSFGKPSKSKFAAQLVQAIGREGAGISYEYDSAEFRLLREDGRGEVNLANLYEEHCSLPKADRPGHLHLLASIVASQDHQLPELFEDAMPNLRPKIWSRSVFDMMDLKRQLDGGDRLDVPLYPLGEHLYSSIVFDTPHAMRSISAEQLENWGISYYQALEHACRNLDESTTAFAKLGDHFMSSMSGDNYDSSRIMLFDRIQSMDVDGDYIAVVPQRDALYVADSEDEQSLSIMFELTARTISEESRPLSPLPMRLEDGEWVDWEPPKDHPLRRQYEELGLPFFRQVYAEQKELLEAITRADPEAPFVASFTVVENQDTGRLLSYCVWSEGVHSLLPETQLVMLTRGGAMVASGEWEQVRDVVGDLMVRDENYYPVRYRVREFPGPAHLSEIGKISALRF